MTEQTLEISRDGASADTRPPPTHQLRLVVPPSLADQLAHEAAECGVPLNDWMLFKLRGAYGRRGYASASVPTRVARWKTRC
jgi:hypothetical protein